MSELRAIIYKVSNIQKAAVWYSKAFETILITIFSTKD